RGHVDAGDVLALGTTGDLDRHVVHASGNDALEAFLDRGPRFPVGRTAQNFGRAHARAAGTVEQQPAESGVGAADPPVRTDDGDTERSRLEKAGEPRSRRV